MTTVAAEGLGVLPGWAMIDSKGPGLRFLFGWCDLVEDNGARFLRLSTGPPDEDGTEVKRLIALRRVDQITPCTEETARRECARQWNGGSR